MTSVIKTLHVHDVSHKGQAANGALAPPTGRILTDTAPPADR